MSMKCKATYKDLNKYRMYRERYKTRYRMKTGSGLYPRKAYTEQENQMILEHKLTDRKLATELNRSVTAIQTQRSRLKAEREKENG